MWARISSRRLTWSRSFGLTRFSNSSSFAESSGVNLWLTYSPVLAHVLQLLDVGP